MNKPNLFLVNAAKAGTTSLYNYLNAHSDIFMSPIKEPNFFGSDIRWEDFEPDYRERTAFDAEKYFHGTKLGKRHIAFLDKKEQYLKLFEKGSQKKYKGEASTSYLYSKNAAREIYSFNPDAKIIIVLREPVDRTISHYLMDLKGMAQNERDITEGLKKDFYVSKKGWGVSHLYIELSLYFDQIERYLMIFPREQILLLEYENLKNDQQDLLNRIMDFLELDYSKMMDNKLKEKFNRTLVPKNKFLKKLSGVRKAVPKSFVNFIRPYMSFLYQERTDFKIPASALKFVRDLVNDDWKKTQTFL